MKLICLLIFFLVGYVVAYNGDAILLDDVKAITLRAGEYTNGRRTAPIPQLNCVGGSARSRWELQPDVVQCVNVGKDSRGNIQWECKAELDSQVRFGKTTVSCEGYNYPEDPYILRDSCGLEYSLEYTQGSHYNSYHNSYHYDTGNSMGGFLVFIFIVIVMIFIISQCASSPTVTSSSGPIPPPGYGYYGGHPSGYPGSGPYYSGGSSWRPGFWSGAGLGYLFGRNTGQGYSYGSRGWSSGSSWGGSSGRSSTRTSSAFASTSRR